MKKVLFLMLLFLPLKAGAVNFTIQLSTTQVAVVANAYDYQVTLPDGTANPEGPVAFVFRLMKKVLADDWANKNAQKQARAAYENELQNKINIP